MFYTNFNYHLTNFNLYIELFFRSFTQINYLYQKLTIYTTRITCIDEYEYYITKEKEQTFTNTN